MNWDEIVDDAGKTPMTHLYAALGEIERDESPVMTYALAVLHSDGNYDLHFKGNRMAAVGLLRVFEVSLTGDQIREFNE